MFLVRSTLLGASVSTVPAIIGACRTDVSASDPHDVPAPPADVAVADIGQTVWRPIKIGAGGFVTGIDIALDGTKVCRCDTFGAYIWCDRAAEWRPLLTAASMPSGEWGHEIVGDMGVYEIAIAPSDANRIYVVFNGCVFRSADKGVTFAKTDFPRATLPPNDEFRSLGRKMAVDPANPETVYVGTQDKGLLITHDGGASWTKHADVPVSTTGAGIIIAFDPSSGTVSGKTRSAYVSSSGHGVFRTTNCDVSFEHLAGSPKTHRHLVCDASGTVWLTEMSSKKNARRFSGRDWMSLSAGDDIHAIAVNPANARHVVAGSVGGRISQSFDGGIVWRGAGWLGRLTGEGRRLSTDIPWLGWTNERFMTNGDMTFDPSVPDKLYFAEGIGVWHCDPSDVFLGVQWISQSKGIEQLVSNHIVSPEGGGAPLYFCWDRPVFRIADPDVFSLTHGPGNDNAIVMGWAGDYSAKDSGFVAGLMNWWGHEESGFSLDGGSTWSRFATVPADVTAGKIGGCLAVSTADNLVWIPSNNSSPFYTRDRGATWTPSNVAPVTRGDETGWGWAHYLDRHIVAADRVKSGVFYAYNYLSGVLRSENGGADWTIVHPGEIAAFSGFNAKMAAVPGKAGHLFFTAGWQAGSNPSSTMFMRSTDSGGTWTAIADALEVYSFGFGKEAAGSDYPTIFIAGYIRRKWGIWRSTDSAASWMKIGDFPVGSFDSIKTVAGDMNIFGRVYVGFTGSGAAYGEYQDR